MKCTIRTRIPTTISIFERILVHVRCEVLYLCYNVFQMRCISVHEAHLSWLHKHTHTHEQKHVCMYVCVWPKPSYCEREIMRLLFNRTWAGMCTLPPGTPCWGCPGPICRCTAPRSPLGTPWCGDGVLRRRHRGGKVWVYPHQQVNAHAKRVPAADGKKKRETKTVTRRTRFASVCAFVCIFIFTYLYEYHVESPRSTILKN